MRADVLIVVVVPWYGLGIPQSGNLQFPAVLDDSRRCGEPPLPKVKMKIFCSLHLYNLNGWENTQCHFNFKNVQNIFSFYTFAEVLRKIRSWGILMRRSWYQEHPYD